MDRTDFYKKLIKPIRDKHLIDIVASAGPEEYSPWDQQLNWEERLAPINQLRKNFISWSKEWLHGLENFPYMYIMNGNTDSLNTIFSLSKETMSWQKGDYSYYLHWHKTNNKPYNELEAPTNVTDIILSWPGYVWGNADQLSFAKKCNAVRMHLDCAYLGLVEPKSIDVSEFETASISFSKTLSIPYNRIGILFSKNEIPSLALMNKLGYVNLSGVKLVNYIMERFPLEYWWNTYSDKLDRLCKENNIKKTDCLLFGYNDNNRISLSEYWKNFL